MLTAPAFFYAAFGINLELETAPAPAHLTAAQHDRSIRRPTTQSDREMVQHEPARAARSARRAERCCDVVGERRKHLLHGQRVSLDVAGLIVWLDADHQLY